MKCIECLPLFAVHRPASPPKFAHTVMQAHRKFIRRNFDLELSESSVDIKDFETVLLHALDVDPRHCLKKRILAVYHASKSVAPPKHHILVNVWTNTSDLTKGKSEACIFSDR